MQCTVTASPGFQLRTAEPTRSTTPAASLPITWNGWSWRAPHTLSAPEALQEPNVGSGSKIDVHTVLKLIDDAITATNASSGASSGSGNSSTWIDLRGSLSSDAHAREHLLLVGLHDGAPDGLGQRQRGELVAGRAVEDRVADGIDLGVMGTVTVAPPR